jgi:hypothetical protein
MNIIDTGLFILFTLLTLLWLSAEGRVLFWKHKAERWKQALDDRINDR